MNNTYHKRKNSCSSNTSSFLYLIKEPNRNDGYICNCDSCIELKDKIKVQDCITYKKTKSQNDVSHIFYGSDKKRMTIQEFFGSFADYNNEDNDNTIAQQKRERFRKPIAFRLPI